MSRSVAAASWESAAESVGVAAPLPKTPAKTPRHSRTRVSENNDPNLPISSSLSPQKAVPSPAAPRSAKSRKQVALACSNPSSSRILTPPPPPVQNRKFLVAKKNARKGDSHRDVSSRKREAYEALRASQDGFFLKDRGVSAGGSSAAMSSGDADALKTTLQVAEEKKAAESLGHGVQNATKSPGNGLPAAKDHDDESSELQGLEGSVKVRKMRSMMLEDAMSTIPERGSGRVMHLVKAFESLLSISKDKGDERVDESRRKVINWALPGLQPPPPPPPMAKLSSVSSSTEFFPSKDFERDSSRFCSSFDSTLESSRLSWGGRMSGGGRRSRRNSSDSTGRNWDNKLRVTSQQPFKLRTEQRGRLKEEHFLKKVKEMLMEEEKLRIPIAQGLPWTTDEPECLVKPPAKEATEPVDLVLHTDVRAVDRAGFDQYVAERLSLAEQMRLERERQEKMKEEEEVRRLRKELVPKAQPMPYFDRPFVPKRSSRPRTVPKEPKFHTRSCKPCVSDNETAEGSKIAKFGI